MNSAAAATMRRLGLLLLALLPNFIRARVILSVDVSSSETRASVLENGNTRATASCTASEDDDGGWTGLARACRSALDEASCTLADVASIELHAGTAQSPRMLTTPKSGRPIIVEPSVLAADIGALGTAARTVAAAGAEWVHVDITDGSVEAGRSLSSLGPSSVAAVRAAAPELKIDVHLYVCDPEEHVAAVANAGADRITFQMETMGSGAGAQRRAAALAAAIADAGCCAGVCIAPPTPVDAVAPLCDAGLVDLVDVLTVNPGIGGQKLQPALFDKVRALRARHPQLPYLLVDGGIDDTTAPLAAAAGANALVSGSYLFRAPPGGMGERLALIENALAELGD